jgi:hypothetical protein
MDDNIFYHRTISENLDKGFQVNLVINDFRDVTYIQLRKYFLSYDGEWIPSREGVSVPATMETIYALLDGLLEVCSVAEGAEVIEHYYNKLVEKQLEQAG